MKSIGLVILAAGITFLPQRLNAQTTGNNGVPDSIVQITAEAQGLPLVPPDQLPPFGTFWLMQPGSIGTVPLPCPPDNQSFPIFQMADGQYLVDGTISAPPASISEAVMAAQAQAVVNLIAEVQTDDDNRRARALARMLGADDINPPGAGSGGDGGDYTPRGGSPMPIDTNRLWLEMITVTNQTASLVIHPSWSITNEVYDLLYCTNLLVPPALWQWVLRSYPQETNLLVPNATDAQGFYRLSSPNDNMANSSLGTNFWLAFCGLYNDGSNQLSLTISSPAGATGRVTTPGLWTNGPTVIVSDCGDAAVNGTNVFRQLTPEEQAAWLTLGLSPIYSGYVRGTNWVVVYGGYCHVVAYDSIATNCTRLYEKYGIDLTGSTNEWVPTPDAPSAATPATLCEQVPFVSQFFTVAAGTGTNISIPLAAMMGTLDADYDVVQTNGISISASQPVAVYGLDYDQYASTAFTGYPTTMLGSNYCVMARAALIPASAHFSQFGIVATASNTTVTITPSQTADLVGHPGTNAYSLTNLQVGETYQVRSQNDEDDVTGTWINSDKPIAVFAGADAAYVPDEGTWSGNPLLQEQLPVDSWGRQVLTLPFAALNGGDSYRVLAADNNTVMWTNGVVAGTNQAGQFLDLIIDGPVEFQASQPIQVAQFANGFQFDNATNIFGQPNEGDPCEILLPPIGHCLLTNIVVTGPSADFSVFPPTGFGRNYLNIIVLQSAITNTLVDGSHVAATNFVAIGSSGYYGAQILVTNGLHSVTSTQPVEVQVYGFGYTDAYGYMGGIVR